jgi:nicotinamidase-related amidase
MSQTLEKCALLIIDMQKGLFNRPPGPIYKETRLLGNINSLINRANSAEAPVIYVHHSNDSWLAKESDNWQFHPSLLPPREEQIIQKLGSNAFWETDLQEKLNALNVKKLVIVGVLTQGCVQQTCIGAKDLSYQTVLVEDGHSNFEENAPELIQEWNEKLSKEGIIIKATVKIDFS